MLHFLNGALRPFLPRRQQLLGRDDVEIDGYLSGEVRPLGLDLLHLLILECLINVVHELRQIIKYLVAKVRFIGLMDVAFLVYKGSF